MPLASTQGFVLGCTPFNEQDRLVHLFTIDKGTIRAIAPGSMKVRNRFGSLFELFTEGEFQYYWQENRELITISRGEILRSFFSTVSKPDNIFYFYLIAEILQKFIPPNHRDNRLYRLVNAVLTHSSEGIDVTLALLYFLVWVLKIEGMMFDPRICYNCYSHDIEQAWMKSDFQGILCRECKTTENIILVNEDLQFLKWTEHHSPKELAIWKEKIDTSKLIRGFTRKIEFHAESTLKSAQYLTEFT